MVKGVLVDLSGTVHVGNQPVPGAVEAVSRLLDSDLAVRFVTNTSRMTCARLFDKLHSMGFAIPRELLFTAPLAVHRYLVQHELRPHLLVHPDLVAEFDDLPQDDPNAVVIGFAQHAFTYANLNQAFRLLKAGAPLIATGRTRYFFEGEGLNLNTGPFIAALEYAAETEAVILGKPSPGFFLQAVREFGVSPGEVVMIGDDAVSDVDAALAAGLQGVLVRTGKYQDGDEARITRDGAEVVDNVFLMVDRLLAG